MCETDRKGTAGAVMRLCVKFTEVKKSSRLWRSSHIVRQKRKIDVGTHEREKRGRQVEKWKVEGRVVCGNLMTCDSAKLTAKELTLFRPLVLLSHTPNLRLFSRPCF